MRSFLLGAKTEVKSWTNPYVTDGLVVYWDGEWNAGGGVHDANAATWKDLVGEHDLSISNGTWHDKELQFNAGRAYNEAVRPLVDAVKSGEFTIEYGGFFDIREGIVYQNESAGFKIGGSMSSIWTSASTTDQGSTFWSKTNMVTLEIVSAYPNRYESRFGWDDSMTNHPSATSVMSGSQQAGIGTRRCAAQFVGSNGECRSYVDLSFYNSALVNLDAAYKKYGFALGSYANKSYMTYNFFRAYNRALTQEELSRNYAVDKRRFGL